MLGADTARGNCESLMCPRVASHRAFATIYVTISIRMGPDRYRKRLAPSAGSDFLTAEKLAFPDPRPQPPPCEEIEASVAINSQVSRISESPISWWRSPYALPTFPLRIVMLFLAARIAAVKDAEAAIGTS